MQSEIITNNIKLIIIDSIAALPRKESLTENDREIFIFRQSSILKRTAELCGCAVLVTNQIVTDASDFVESSHASGTTTTAVGRSLGRRDSLSSGVLRDRITDTTGGYRPALGATWAYCITTRLIMFTTSHHQQPQQHQHQLNEMNSVRTLSLVKSPVVGAFETCFAITNRGIESVEYSII